MNDWTDAHGNGLAVGDKVRVLEDAVWLYRGEPRSRKVLEAGDICEVKELVDDGRHAGNIYINDWWAIAPESVELVEEGPSNDSETAKAGVSIYVAGPYSKGDVDKNVRLAVYAAETLFQAGKDAGVLVAPLIPHQNKVWHDLVPHGYQDWLDMDFVLLAQCDACFRVPGESPGADRERAVCESLGIPFFTSHEEATSWIEDQR